MYFKSKKISLLILGITSIICSRTMLVSFNDPEGPNLLIIAVMALFVWLPSLAVYWLNLSITGFKRLLLAISTQVIIVTVLYFFLR